MRLIMRQERETKTATITRLDVIRFPGEPFFPLTKLAGAVVEVDNANECIVSVPQLPDGAALKRMTVTCFKNGDPWRRTDEYLWMLKDEWVSMESYLDTLDAHGVECFGSDLRKFVTGFAG